MKTLLAILLLSFSPYFAFADSWALPTPQTVSSPEGKFLLRSIPPKRLDDAGKKWSKILFIVYRLDPISQDYQETRRFHVEDHPIEVLINDAGDRIVTLDQYFGIGQGPRVIAVYDGRGKELRTWGLKEFYDKKKIKTLPESTASVHWRGEAAWMHDQSGVWLSKPSSLPPTGGDHDDYLLDVRRLKVSKRAFPE